MRKKKKMKKMKKKKKLKKKEIMLNIKNLLIRLLLRKTKIMKKMIKNYIK